MICVCPGACRCRAQGFQFDYRLNVNRKLTDQAVSNPFLLRPIRETNWTTTASSARSRRTRVCGDGSGCSTSAKATRFSSIHVQGESGAVPGRGMFWGSAASIGAEVRYVLIGSAQSRPARRNSYPYCAMAAASKYPLRARPRGQISQ